MRITILNVIRYFVVVELILFISYILKKYDENIFLIIIESSITLLIILYIYKNIKIYNRNQQKYLITFTALLILNLLFFPIINISIAIKIYSYLLIFYLGLKISNYPQQTTINRYSKKWLVLLLLIPIIGRFLIKQELIPSAGSSMSFFVNSNTYVYWGIASSLAIILFFKRQTFFVLYILFFLITGKTIGAVSSCLITFIIIYYRRIKFKDLIIISLVALSLLLLIKYSDLIIFDRIKNTTKVFIYLYNNYSFNDIFFKINYEDYGFMMNADDDASFLFRFQLWGKIWLGIVNSNVFEILFGHGTGMCYKDFLIPHNEYIRIIYDYGVVFLVLILGGFYYVYVNLKKTSYLYVFFVVLIYSFSENLYTNYLASSLFFFLLGICVNINQKKKNTGGMYVQHLQKKCS